MSKFNAGWFVIYTKPRHEKKVTEQLGKAAVNAFLPTVKTLRTWCDRKKYIETPLFPSYVFVHLTDTQCYLKSLDIDGVLHYVRTGKEIARISDTVIDHIRLAVQGETGMEISYENFRPGRQLMIREGVFTGYCCEVVQYKGKEKILVRISLLQRSILLNLPAEQLMCMQEGSLTC
ncbi:UpxY family transcription antiterminator [Deminuibacter soli]|uniref:UpxY family transcription antiterminator n=1 Tax=Deminuibacter soli TaxID=2291815 RepID=A0A3E1NGL0_9BACT|nr:UpxY family transcription antiterminator [Deminuibacter soli]RFM26928.1 UpxY family transcription antiterminator [Deminuibacter soli]